MCPIEACLEVQAIQVVDWLRDKFEFRSHWLSSELHMMAHWDSIDLSAWLKHPTVKRLAPVERVPVQGRWCPEGLTLLRLADGERETTSVFVGESDCV